MAAAYLAMRHHEPAAAVEHLQSGLTAMYDTPWERWYLEFREQAYRTAGDPRGYAAARELNEFKEQSGTDFVESILTIP